MRASERRITIEVPNLPQALVSMLKGAPRAVTRKPRREERAYFLKGDRVRKKSKDPWLRQHGANIQHHVYVVSAPNGLVKIGCAYDIQLRLEQLQAQCPVQLTLRRWVLWAGKGFERRLHQLLRPYRSHGEWFDVDVARVGEIVEALVEETRAATK